MHPTPAQPLPADAAWLAHLTQRCAEAAYRRDEQLAAHFALMIRLVRRRLKRKDAGR